MSADENKDDVVKALEDAGHTDAATFLTEQRAEREREELAKRGPGQPAGSPGIPLVSDAALGDDAQARREGAALLETLRAAGVGRYVSGGRMLGDER